MRIATDVDGVLADFNPAYAHRIVAITGKDRFADPPVFDSWHFAEKVGYTNRELNLVWDDIRRDGTFWMNLKPYSDISDAMSCLRWRYARGDDVYFITARPGLRAKRQTEEWLLARQEYLKPMPPTVLMSADKGACCAALQLDYYLDDRFENAVDVAATDTKSYLLTRPWNVQYCTPAKVTRVSSVEEFFADIP